LLTDGVHNCGNVSPLTAAEIAKQYNVRIYTIGIGRNGMAPFPTGYNSTRMVPVEIDEKTMTQISEETGGKYFRAEENEELFALARENKVLLMEALKSVFLPIIRKTKEMLQKQEIGEIEQIYASFMRNGSHMENHWINDPRTGGALKDLGTYTIGTMNYLMGTEPVLIRKWTNGTASHSDTIAYVDLDYNGIKGRSEVSNSMDGNHTLIVYGTKGKIQIDDFWKTGKGLLISEKGELEINEELISDFYYELKHFTDLCDQHILESEIMNKEASDRILKITQ